MWGFIVNFASIMAGFILAVSYVPQIWTLYKTKEASGMSKSFWFILDFSLLLLFILALDSYLIAGTVGLLIAQSLNLALALVVTAQVLYYGKNKKNKQKIFKE